MEAGWANSATWVLCSIPWRRSADGTDKGRLYAQGTARVGDHLGVQRVPVIKKQAISAYDPRVIEVTGITMMVTAQGADHTAGNVPRMKTVDKTTDEIVDASMEAQVLMAAADSLGFCIFGRSVTNMNLQMIAEADQQRRGHESRRQLFRGARPRNPASGGRLQPSSRFYGRRRRATGILLRRTAAPDRQGRALPRAGGAKEHRTLVDRARLSCAPPRVGSGLCRLAQPSADTCL